MKNKRCGKIRVLFLVLLLGGCSSTPESYFRSPGMETAHGSVKAAILPFTNLTQERDAEKKIAYALVAHLLRSKYFDVVEMGETERALREIKLQRDETLSVEKIKQLGKQIGADVLLMGEVEEYKIDSGTLMGERIFVPEVALSARLVSTQDGSILWAVNHHRRGDEKVTVFGMGRVDSISQLTEIIMEDMVGTLERAIVEKDGAVAVLRGGRPQPKTEAEIKQEEKDREVMKIEKDRLAVDNETLKKELVALKEKLEQDQIKSAKVFASTPELKRTTGASPGPNIPPAVVLIQKEGQAIQTGGKVEPGKGVYQVQYDAIKGQYEKIPGVQKN